MKKKILSLALATALCLGLTTIPAAAAGPAASYKGIALAQNTDGLWGFIDPNGNPVTPFEWSFAWPENYSQGIAFEESNILYAVHKDTQQIYKLELTQGDEVPTLVYVDNGTEMKAPFTGNQPYQVNPSPVTLNGAPINMSTITLTDANGGGYTYFKLRDIGLAIGFDVTWSAETGISITTHPF